MVVEIGGCGEPLAADATLVRLFSRMDAPVCVQGGRGGESFATDVTHVRLLSRVGA